MATTPYLSAMAVLRFVYPAIAWAAAMAQSEAMGNTNPWQSSE
jgi:hypothetical protein